MVRGERSEEWELPLTLSWELSPSPLGFLKLIFIMQVVSIFQVKGWASPLNTRTLIDKIIPFLLKSKHIE